MTERPILMSAPMVRASMREIDPKTQTRRGVSPQPDWPPEVQSTYRTEHIFWPIGGLGQQCGAPLVTCPHGLPGDRLWVREAYRLGPGYDGTKPSAARPNARVWYEADQQKPEGAGRLRPSIHMPRRACRLILEITEVRVERLNDCSDDDALAEGIQADWVIVGANCNGGVHTEEHGWRYFWEGGPDEGYESPVEAYAALWDAINGAGAWDANPWVWVISFRRIQA